MCSKACKSPQLDAAGGISFAMAGTVSARWRIIRPGSYNLFGVCLGPHPHDRHRPSLMLRGD